jgi:hypothetical protein
MAVLAVQQPSFNDSVLLKLAREIAMDIREIADILATYELDDAMWQEIQGNWTFKQYLRGAIEEWNSATNTQERVKMKALSMVEEALPEFYTRMHDKGESLQHKTEVFKTITKLAGLERTANDPGTGERLTVTINLGADQQLKIERDVTPKVTDEKQDSVSVTWNEEMDDE